MSKFKAKESDESMQDNTDGMFRFEKRTTL